MIFSHKNLCVSASLKLCVKTGCGFAAPGGFVILLISFQLGRLWGVSRFLLPQNFLYCSVKNGFWLERKVRFFQKMFIRDGGSISEPEALVGFCGFSSCFQP
jgi:hypothetical protein